MIALWKNLRQVVFGLLGEFRRSERNVLWNLLGGGSTGILIVVATPQFVSLLGLAGYGMLGLWLAMQVIMGLLDVGMGATLIKEFANKDQSRTALGFKRNLLRTLEIVYWSLAAVFTLSFALGAEWIGLHWLNASEMPTAYVVDVLQLMAIALGLQFPYSLYSSGLVGLQAQGRMNALQVAGNCLRYGCGVAVLFWRADLIWFFVVQSIVAAIQTFGTRHIVWRMIHEPTSPAPAFDTTLIKRLWRFSMGMAITSMVAVLLANADRIALSKMVSTTEIGKYAVAFTATGLLQMGIQPFYRAFFPRYAELVADKGQRLRDEYFRSCQLMAAVIVPVGIIGWVFAPQIFGAWIGQNDETIVTVFRWLVIGITCSGLVWLPAAFQQAHGWTRLHAAMIAGALVLGTPVMILAINTYGTVGATAVWVLHGLSDITLGLWLMHRRLLTGELFHWYLVVLLPPLVVSPMLVGLAFWSIPDDLNRWAALGFIGVTGITTVALTLFVSNAWKHQTFQTTCDNKTGK